MKKLFLLLSLVLIVLSGCLGGGDKNKAPELLKLTIGSSSDYVVNYGTEYEIEVVAYDKDGVNISLRSEKNSNIENTYISDEKAIYLYNPSENIDKLGSDTLYLTLEDTKGKKKELSFNIEIKSENENSAPELISAVSIGKRNLTVEENTRTELIISYIDPENEDVVLEPISEELTIEDEKYYYTSKEIGVKELEFILEDDKGNKKNYKIDIEVIGSNSMVLMVYIAGDNNLGEDGGLESWSYAMKDIIEMSAADLNRDSNVKTVILADFYETSELSSGGDESAIGYYEITNNDKDIIRFINKEGKNIEIRRIKKLKDFDSFNTGEKDTLKDFINYTYEKYKAKTNILTIWGHGNGWFGYERTLDRAIAFDDGAFFPGQPYPSLSIQEVKEAIENSEMEYVDVLYTDACLMGMAEVAYEWKDVCSYFATSPELTPGEGGDYEGILKKLDTISRNESKEIAKKSAIAIQEANFDFYYKEGKNSAVWKEYDTLLGVVYSVFDQSKADVFFEKLNIVSEELKNEEIYDQIKENYLSYEDYNELSTYADLGDFLKQLELNNMNNVNEILDLLNPENDNSYLIYLKKQSEEYPMFSIVGDESASTGMAIYFPKKGSKTLSYEDFDNYRYYSKFARDYNESGWTNFLESYKIWYQIGNTW